MLQPSSQTHPRLRVGPTPVLPPPLWPQIPQGVIPGVVKAGAHLLQMSIVNRSALLAQLWQAALGEWAKLVTSCRILLPKRWTKPASSLASPAIAGFASAEK